jgi:hypothetical protein
MDPGSYVLICAACDHPLSSHLRAPAADSIAGPYPCTAADCQCEYRQYQPTLSIDKATGTTRFATR